MVTNGILERNLDSKVAHAKTVTFGIDLMSYHLEGSEDSSGSCLVIC